MYIPSDTLITNSLSEATYTSQTSSRLQHMWHGSWLVLISDEDCGWYTIFICPHSTIHHIHWKKEGSYEEPSLSAATWAFALLLSIHISSNSSQALLFIFSCQTKWQHPRVQHRLSSGVCSVQRSSESSSCQTVTSLTSLTHKGIFESPIICNIGKICHTSTIFQDLAPKCKDVSTFFNNNGAKQCIWPLISFIEAPKIV